MAVSKIKISRFILMLAFLFCMFFANFYAVRKIIYHGVEVYLYDKLVVAYDIGGKDGINKELNKILTLDKMPHELALAREFQAQYKDLKDPIGYLRQKAAESRGKVMLFRNLRSAAIILLLLIFTWRMLLNLSQKARGRKILK